MLRLLITRLTGFVLWLGSFSLSYESAALAGVLVVRVRKLVAEAGKLLFDWALVS